MVVAAKVKKFLDSYRVLYRIVNHRRAHDLEKAITYAKVDRSKVVRTEVLTDGKENILAVIPFDRKIDFIKIKKYTDRNLRLLPISKANRIFTDCESGAYPPFGEPYGLTVFMDSLIETIDPIYFQAGSYASVVQLSRDDFLYVNARSQRLSFISDENYLDSDFAEKNSAEDIIAEGRIEVFPNLPIIAKKILQLNMEGKYSVNELIEIIAKDELMHKQILNYANLPFLKSECKVDNMQDVVQHVLGFERVSHIALGMAAGRAFNLQEKPSVYLKEFWKHSFYCAILAEHITAYIAERKGIDPCMSYLVGLLHNFGMLLFSQLFPPEFKLLSRWLKLNPKVSVTVLEKRLLGMGQALHILRDGHTGLGANLLQHWELPQQTWVVAREHHNINYTGEYVEYVKVVWLANRILRNYGIGDGVAGEISNNQLKLLDLTKEELDTVVAQVMSGASELDGIVKILT